MMNSSDVSMYYEWAVNSGNINAPTSASVIAYPGSYTLNAIRLWDSAYTDYGCCASQIINVLPCGCIPLHRIEETLQDTIKHMEVIKIYPNPTANWFYIEGINNNEEEVADLIISNLQGQVIYRGKIVLQSGVWKYQAELKQSGMYLIRIDTKNKIFRNTIISIKD